MKRYIWIKRIGIKNTLRRVNQKSKINSPKFNFFLIIYGSENNWKNETFSNTIILDNFFEIKNNLQKVY